MREKVCVCVRVCARIYIYIYIYIYMCEEKERGSEATLALSTGRMAATLHDENAKLFGSVW
jgi:hypothetical protein